MSSFAQRMSQIFDPQELFAAACSPLTECCNPVVDATAEADLPFPNNSNEDHDDRKSRKRSSGRRRHVIAATKGRPSSRRADVARSKRLEALDSSDPLNTTDSTIETSYESFAYEHDNSLLQSSNQEASSRLGIESLRQNEPKEHDSIEEHQPNGYADADWDDLMDVSETLAGENIDMNSLGEHGTVQRYALKDCASQSPATFSTDVLPSEHAFLSKTATNSKFKERKGSNEQAVRQALADLGRLCGAYEDRDRNDARSQAYRHTLSQTRLPSMLLSVMNQYKTSVPIQIECYRIVGNMAHDSPAFCKAAVHTEATKHNMDALETILAGMQSFADNEDIQVNGLGALLMLVRGSQDRSERLVLDLLGGPVVIAAMRAFPGCHDLQELGSILLAVLCDFPRLRMPLVKAGGVRVVDELLQGHARDKQLACLGRKTMAQFCARQHLYDEDGKRLFRFYQEPLKASTPVASLAAKEKALEPPVVDDAHQHDNLAHNLFNGFMSLIKL